jgi:hypothetical protein
VAVRIRSVLFVSSIVREPALAAIAVRHRILHKCSMMRDSGGRSGGEKEFGAITVAEIHLTQVPLRNLGIKQFVSYPGSIPSSGLRLLVILNPRRLSP